MLSTHFHVFYHKIEAVTDICHASKNNGSRVVPK